MSASDPSLPPNHWTEPTLLGLPLQRRWRRCTPELRALASGLEAELAPLLRGASLPIPEHKAQLTRIGGRCSADGTPLTFEPWQPHEHRCPTCGRVYVGVEHDQWWAMGAMLWSAERTLHAAMLGSMWQRDDLLALATSALDQFSTRWPTYPNQDNALGPTRPFFSTYLESVWLLNVSLAASVLRTRDDSHATVSRFVSRVVEPSRALIRSYPEGASNRQTWHTAAQLAAAALLDDRAAIAELVDGELGVHSLLRDGLLDDGSWYEGENYHLFAHRGLWYGVTMLEALGIELPTALRARFDTGFRTPLLGMLPDGTFPSRRDSRYAVSVHQWRFAEWCELGLARTGDPVLAMWLHRLYADAHPHGDTGRSRSTADIERDEPPGALSRVDLGWRTLLCAREDMWNAPAAGVDESAVLPSQGLAILRRDEGCIYVALECGHTGGAHGHPDRLGLTIQDGTVRMLEDPGAGSYVERTLHWYRSTLAHNAPLIDGHSQRPVPARLLAFDANANAHADAGWIRADASGMATDVRVVRTVVLFDEHVIDHLAWWSPREITMDLPFHVAGETNPDRVWVPANPGGAGGLEDGFDFLDDVATCAIIAGAWTELSDASARAWYRTNSDATLWRATAPGPPRTSPRRFHWLRVRQAHGEMLGVWSLRDSVRAPLPASIASLLPVTLTRRDGSVVEHRAGASGWHIEVRTSDSVDRIALGGLRAVPRTTPRDAPLLQPPAPPLAIVHGDAPTRFHLGIAHYRGAEASWEEAGSPEATVSIQCDATSLHVLVDARTGPITVPAAGSENPFDNERADINADGVQCYVGPDSAERWSSAWLIVPDPDTGGTRLAALVPDSAPVESSWTRTDAGWQMHLRVPLASTPDRGREPFRFDLIVNERPAHCRRRRGQLVLSGSTGEFVYLRGDRHDPRRALRLQLTLPMHTVSSPAPFA